MNYLKLIIMVGPPGCGKSLWAKIYVNKHKARRVNRDDLRAMMYEQDYKFQDSDESAVRRIRDYIIENWLNKGYDVVVDDTNLTPDIFPSMCALADRINDYVEVSEQIIHIDYSLCDHNNKNRWNAVPQDKWNDMWLQYKSHQEPMPYLSIPSSIMRDAYLGEYGITNLPKCAIVDLDKTLALYPHGRNQFDHTQIPNDIPNTPIIDMLFTLNNTVGLNIFIITGRSDIARHDTEVWLQEHGITYTNLYMRPDGNEEPDYVIKKNFYENKIKDKYFVTCVFEDREAATSMWRSLNLPTYQVDFGRY